jgi:6-phosphogluconolactonase
VNVCYIGTYTHTGSRGQGILMVEYYPDTGEFTPARVMAAAENPSWLIQANSYLLACVETDRYTPDGQGGVLSFRVENDKNLKQLGQAASGGAFPCHLCYAPRQGLIFASNYGSGTVGILSLAQDGRLTLLDILVHQGSGPRSEQEGPHSHCAVLSRDGNKLYVCDLGIDKVMVYNIESGKPPFNLSAQIKLPPGSGPRHAVLSADGSYLFILCELSCQIFVCRLENGWLSEPYPVVDVHKGVFAAAAAIRLWQGGTKLVVSCRGIDCLTYFDILPDGMLDNRVMEPCPGRWPRDFDFCPGDERVALLAYEKSAYIQFWRHEGTISKEPPEVCGTPVSVCWWKYI